MGGDERALEAMRKYHARHKILPQMSVLTRLMGTYSKSWATTRCQSLSKSGYLEKIDGRWKPGPKFFDQSEGAR